jgi:hypothetical protein
MTSHKQGKRCFQMTGFPEAWSLKPALPDLRAKNTRNWRVQIYIGSIGKSDFGEKKPCIGVILNF